MSDEEQGQTADQRPSTTPPNLSISIQGFEDEHTARSLGHQVGAVIRRIGEVMDLSSLDGVTIAVDYDAALRELDRGVPGLRQEQRTNDGVLTGVAKASLVRRDGHVKTHLVFYAAPLCAFVVEDATAEDVNLAIGLVAHECGHVEEHGVRDRQFPGLLLEKQVEGFVPIYLQQFSESFWCEYSVCRSAAPFCDDHEAGYREGLCLRLEPAREAARRAITEYRTHGDLTQVFVEVGKAVVEPLRMASYLFGHLDGSAAEDLPEVTPEIPETEAAFVSAIETLVGQLRDLWDRRGEWESHDDMLVLGETAFDLLRDFGVDVQPQPDGEAYIDVPFTPDTMPGFPSAAGMLGALFGRRG